MKKLQLPALFNAKKMKRSELKNVFGGDFEFTGSGGNNNGYNCCRTGTRDCKGCVKMSTEPNCGIGYTAIPCHIHQLIHL